MTLIQNSALMVLKNLLQNSPGANFLPIFFLQNNSVYGQSVFSD